MNENHHDDKNSRQNEQSIIPATGTSNKITNSQNNVSAIQSDSNSSEQKSSPEKFSQFRSQAPKSMKLFSNNFIYQDRISKITHSDAPVDQNSIHQILSNSTTFNAINDTFSPNFQNNSFQRDKNPTPLEFAVMNAKDDPKFHNEICFFLLKNADPQAFSSEFKDFIISNQKSGAIKQKRKKRLNKFDWSKSVAWQLICNQFGNNLNQKEILSIAELLSRECGIFLSSEAKNRKELLIQWFDENWENVRFNVRYIRLKNKDKKNIGKDKDP